MRNFVEAIANRRTNYALGKNIPVSKEQVVETVQKLVHEVPSAFNMQSGRIIIATGENHDKIWNITMETLRKIVPAEAFGRTEDKIKGFAAAYGTILYFDETATVKNMQEQFPAYADNFPIWAQQANGMMQFAIWTALTDLGLGVNIQHYNPLIDEEVKKTFGVPDSWQLIAEMPFGEALQAPNAITKLPIDERVKVF
ncbi:nitroreductase family protein [Acidaminococcus sp. NSJ-142]|jgi:predicted oxidoreductase (fatty acid repression mutant protein)|uniref:nitroreductase family protein n=1 Tax=Acidaminococcus TaxID=904 RepID=UPI000CF9F2EE|nr:MULTISPECIES: nitroreductase family protein [Acidaminococcus]MCD2434691.1 nitroreductase family protein [Acidaminococcus hominis]RHK03377.1 nitroreductase [Acidaminococcus sp. AM05-11]